MIGISKLYMGQAEASDPLRYGRLSERLPSHLLQFSKDKKPIVVWNITQRCNLRCKHCYAAGTPDVSRELTTAECKRAIDGFAAFGCPVVLFSGGEPFCQPEALADLGREIKKLGKHLMIYTGYTWERLLEIGRKRPAVLALLDLSDLLVDGPYLEAERDLSLRFRGSANQRVIDLKKTKEHGTVVLYQDEYDQGLW